MMLPDEQAVKPPLISTVLADPETAAMTEGSSTVIGMAYEVPLMRKLRPKPIGSSKVPIQFSIILSATVDGKLSWGLRCGYTSLI